MRWLVLLAVLSGCGRFLFADHPDAANDARGFDTSNPADACPFGAFGPPVRLPGGISIVGADDWSPSISADDLTMYWYTVASSSPGAPDIWHSTRASTTADFPVGSVITEVSSTADDTFPRVTADQLVLVFMSDRLQINDADPYIATRPDTASAFSPPQRIAELSSTLAEEGMWISEDGLRVVFASNRGTSFDLYAADRPDRASAFANLRLLNDVNTLAAEEKPALSADELEIVFSSDRPGTGMLDLWHATRPSVDQPFGPAEELTVLNGPSDEYAPYLSADGTRLYYSYNVETTGGPDDADVWVATRSRSCL